jgi:hypothetical protein
MDTNLKSTSPTSFAQFARNMMGAKLNALGHPYRVMGEYSKTPGRRVLYTVAEVQESMSVMFMQHAQYGVN